ncbi:MAG: DUF2281 domain-containing protein [Candidatus Desantisbacteria bacterium]
MSVAEKIVQHLENMPEPMQAEVFDFVEYLNSKTADRQQIQSETNWSTFSLLQAMRGMENEQTSYCLKDIKEIFS